MDQQLPKIGGVTIERLSKPIPSPDSNEPIAANAPLISHPSQDGNEEEEDEFYDEDELNENDSLNDKGDVNFEKNEGTAEQWDDFEVDGDGDLSDNPGNLSSENDVQFQSSSEDDAADHYNEIREGNFNSNINIPKPHGAAVSSSIPQLPPGVTIERKKSVPTVTQGLPANIHLPAGIQLQKRTTPDPKQSPLINWPQNQPVRPAKGTLRQVRPQRSQAQNSQQFMNLLQSLPGVTLPRQPAVRTVRPRVAPQAPRMMIHDFLEQRMHVGRPGSGFKQPQRRSPQASSFRGPRPQPYPKGQKPDFFQDIFQTMSKGRPSNDNLNQSPKKLLTNIQLPPGITMQPRSVDPIVLGDSDDNFSSSTNQALLKLPPGINVERKKLEKSDLPKPLSRQEEQKGSFSGSPQKGLERLAPQFQLPAGISLQRKSDPPKVLDLQDSEDGEDESELGEEEEEEEVDLDEENYDDFENDETSPQLVNDDNFVKEANKTDPIDSEFISEKEFTDEEKKDIVPSDTSQEMVNENLQNATEVDGEKDEDADKSSQVNEDHNLDDFPDEMDEDEEEEQMGDYDEFDEQNDGDVEPAEGSDPPQPNETEFTEPLSEVCEGETSGSQNIKLDDNDEKEEFTDDSAHQESYDKISEETNDKPEDTIDFESLISEPVIDKSTPQDSLEESMDKSSDQDVMKNLVDMINKGEIEGEIEDDKDEEDEMKKGNKRKAEDGEESGDEGVSSSKKQQLDEEDEAEGDKSPIDKSKVVGSHLRKNIREVMDETKLDETTLAAQRQEAERLKRLQDQQRMIREVQRQIQLNKVAQRHQNQSQVLSMLKGNSETSILKKSSISPVSQLQSSTPNHVLLKMGNGQQTSLSDKMRELLKTPSRSFSEENNTQSLLRQGRLSSSVTIAPIKREPMDDEKKKRKGDVVTLSSDSDDDCIVLSDEEIESEPEDDPTNSGMHTIDKYNVPDEQGRVLVNSGHAPEESDIFLAPQIARIIKPHQVGGVRFLYDNIIESTNLYDSSAGFGCILAHSMGLGKTLQIVSFSDIFLRHTSGKKILCIMPINTIQNWQAEFNMWLPKENHSESEVRCRDFDIFIVNESSKNIHSRGKVILEWHMRGGVLLMGYELFRLLSLRKPIKSKRKRPDDMEEERNRQLVQQIYCALVTPGPDLVICDEGHRIKNSHATTSQALKQIRTRRRVVLTGYPLQNNLLEYWCMVDFVRPNYLGSKTEFSNMFERPIQNGQCIDSTPQDKRLMRFRAHVLHSLLEGFVQRRSHAVLQEVLPQKEEYVLLLRFTAFQRKLYDTFMNDVIRTVVVPNPLKAFAVCCKIWNHPDVLYNFLKKKGEQRDLDLEEALAVSAMPQRMPIDVGMGGPMPPNVPVTPPWPKKGPGSRGGKVRQKKNFAQANLPPPPNSTMDKSSDSLPSMFSSQSSNFSSGYSSAPATPNYQSNYFPQQQPQQTQQPQQQFQPQQPQQTDNYYQTGFDNQTYNSSNPQMYGNNMYGSNQQKQFENHKMFPNEQKPAQNFQSGFNTPANNYYPNQDQFANSNNPSNQSFPQSTGQLNQSQQQFYPPQNDMSVSSGYDYSQNSTDVHQDFPQIPGFTEPTFDNSNYNNPASEFQQPQQQQQNYWGNNWSSSNQGNYSGGSSSDEFISPNKFNNFEEKKEGFDSGFPTNSNQPILPKSDVDEKKSQLPFNSMPNVAKNETDEKKEEVKVETPKKDDIPYDWATELFKNYVAGVIENSSKMEIFFLIMTESILKGDRLLVFSQSLLTLDLLEDYLQKRSVPGREDMWLKNRNYFRLDGSTPALEREKLINEFNINPQVGLFLVSTRAGSLGINLVGANRVVVFDASWNPCHDTQAVCRVYRYGQQKPCYVYRLVMDCSLEKKIYDRQINKQGMADRVVDELNPDAHLSIKEVTNLCWDDQEETLVTDFSDLQEKYHDDIVKLMLAKHSSSLSKAPFQHESLLIDRKEKKLSQAEKRLAKRSYELEKQAANQPRNLYQLFPSSSGLRNLSKPVASVKPMPSQRLPTGSKWITADVWQKQGMSAQELTLPLDVVIPTNSPDKSSIVLKAGQRVMVLKSHKGIYMQLETGKIIAIRTAFKVGDKPDDKKVNPIASALKNNPNVTITSKGSSILARGGKTPFYKSSLDKKAAAVNMAASKGRIAVNNKNRQIIRPSLASKTLPIKKAEEMKDPSINPLPESIKEKLETDKPVESTSTTAESEERRESTIGAPELRNSEQITDPVISSAICDLPSYPAVDSYGIQSNILSSTETPDLGLKDTENSVPDVNAMATHSNDHHPAPENFVTASSTNDIDPHGNLSWPNINESTQKDNSLEQINSLVQKELSVNPAELQKQTESEFRSNFSTVTKDNAEIKKEPDTPNPWAKQAYPMDPYGNFYPGYPGYYAPPMPGYEGYPYPRAYPPPMPIKSEVKDGTPPPAAPTLAQATPAPAPAPPLYPPYPNPYPYGYNYPHYPPQAQPPIPAPQPTTSGKPPDAPDPSPYGAPPYGPRPPYPAPTPAPGYYPNYPPFPNYPFPNYSPYMPPGYAYPMQNPHHMQPHSGNDSSAPPLGQPPEANH